MLRGQISLEELVARELKEQSEFLTEITHRRWIWRISQIMLPFCVMGVATLVMSC